MYVPLPPHSHLHPLTHSFPSPPSHSHLHPPLPLPTTLISPTSATEFPRPPPSLPLRLLSLCCKREGRRKEGERRKVLLGGAGKKEVGRGVGGEGGKGGRGRWKGGKRGNHSSHISVTVKPSQA